MEYVTSDAKGPGAEDANVKGEDGGSNEESGHGPGNCTDEESLCERHQSSIYI